MRPAREGGRTNRILVTQIHWIPDRWKLQSVEGLCGESRFVNTAIPYRRKQEISPLCMICELS